MTKSLLIYAPKIIFDFIIDLMYFLPWWYSRGLAQMIKKIWYFLHAKEQELAILVWLKNINKPLYDEYSWKNSIKSVILRIGQIILRLIILIFWAVVSFLGVLTYAFLPLLIIWEIIYQFI